MALAPQPATPAPDPGAVMNIRIEGDDLPNDPAGLKGAIPDDTDPEYKGILEGEIDELSGYDWLTGQPLDPSQSADPDPDPAPKADPEPDPKADPEPDPKASADPANPDPAADPKADPDPAPDPKADPEPDPQHAIATPDGKGTIPYQTLVRERATSRSLAAELSALKAKYEPGGQPPADPAAADPAKPADPKPEEPAAEDPAERAQRIQAIRDLHGDEIADTIAGLSQTADRLSAKVGEQDTALAEARQREQLRETAEAERSTEALQAAIDSNPTVRGWLDDAIAAKAGEAGKSELMYNIAASIHEELEASDEFRDATYGERLEEVVRIVRGDSARPGTPEVSQDPNPAKTDPDPTKDPDPKAKADPAKPEAEPKADPDPKPPETLSDLPAGDPHLSARERLETMTPQEMEQSVLSGKMSLEALEGLLLAE